MKALIEWKHKKYEIDLDQPVDISIPMHNGSNNPNAFHIPQPVFEPIRVGDFVGSVKMGSGANCENLTINAHGNGMHTECIGHITAERITINQSLKVFYAFAQLISVRATMHNDGETIVEKDAVADLLNPLANAVIIRTLPNATFKKTQYYSGNNPCYLSPALTALFAQKEIAHLLVDLPSVDREEDSGQMLAHKAFWNYPDHPRLQATISEMIYVPDSIRDGLYLLNLQIASLETDASPSKPVLYALREV